VLNEKFIFAQMWVESGSEGAAVLQSLNLDATLPQYAIVDADGKMILRYDRPANVASMTPEGFASYLEDGLKKAAP